MLLLVVRLVCSPANGLDGSVWVIDIWLGYAIATDCVHLWVRTGFSCSCGGTLCDSEVWLWLWAGMALNGGGAVGSPDDTQGPAPWGWSRSRTGSTVLLSDRDMRISLTLWSGVSGV